MIQNTEDMTFINPEDGKRLMVFESFYDQLLKFVAASYTEEEIAEVEKAYARFEQSLKENPLSGPNRNRD